MFCDMIRIKDAKRGIRMSKKKALATWGVIGCMVFALAGCNDVEDVPEDITLTYYHFGENEMVEYLAGEFERTHSNITVNVVYEDEAVYMEKLLEYQEKDALPDVFVFAECDSVLEYGMLSDISEYYNADEETRELLDTIVENRIGCYETTARWAVPVTILPSIMYVDGQVATKLGQELPTQAWTWDEMLSFVKNCTVYDHSDGVHFGLSSVIELDRYYAIAANQTALGEFGFDGTQFHMVTWLSGEEQISDLDMAGYVAPLQGTVDMKDWTGDENTWCGDTGRVAVLAESFEDFEGFSQKVLPYPMPILEEGNSATHNTFARMELGGVSATCEHPEEAYELLKFMSYGIDGWNARIQFYHENKNAAVDSIPCTKNETTWKAYVDMYCAGMNDADKTLWENYFASCKRPIPNGEGVIAGFSSYREEYFDKLDSFHGIVDLGNRPEQLVQEAEKNANRYHAEAMLAYFGAEGYDILDKDAIALYEGMLQK